MEITITYCKNKSSQYPCQAIATWISSFQQEEVRVIALGTTWTEAKERAIEHAKAYIKKDNEIGLVPDDEFMEV